MTTSFYLSLEFPAGSNDGESLWTFAFQETTKHKAPFCSLMVYQNKTKQKKDTWFFPGSPIEIIHLFSIFLPLKIQVLFLLSAGVAIKIMFLWLINPEWMHAIHCLLSFPLSSLSHSVFLESESKNMATGLSFEALYSATKTVSTELEGFFMLWRKKSFSRFNVGGSLLFILAHVLQEKF